MSEYLTLDPHIGEWLGLVVRWFHIVAGIMWIGSSLYFMWLDSAITPPKETKEGVLGELWMVHGGGFYLVEKRYLDPSQVPEVLHWFKWEAAFTWISGILLLAIAYYLGGAAMMLDPGVSGISHGAAVGIGIGVLIISWLVYDNLWKTPLGQTGVLAVAVSFLLVIALAYGLTHVLSGRAAYMHVGAVLGTLMVANVWMHIIPAQRQMIAATKEGRKADPSLGARAKMRSVHNNYMTLPLIFIMLSNHFPSTYGHKLNWLILAGLFLGSALVNHLMNISDRFSAWLPAAIATTAVAVIPLFFLTAPPRSVGATGGGNRVPFGEARAVIVQRCTACHSVAPTDPAFATAPVGVAFDTPEQIQKMADRIQVRAVTSQTMPLGNKTGMTQEERELLGKWIAQGAAIK